MSRRGCYHSPVTSVPVRKATPNTEHPLSKVYDKQVNLGSHNQSKQVSSINIQALNSTENIFKLIRFKRVGFCSYSIEFKYVAKFI